mgnify:CR=1 FL=1
MPHELPVEEKQKDKLVGVDIKILDDGTFMARFNNQNYNKSKEYSYADMDDLFDSLREDFEKETGKRKEPEGTEDEDEGSQMRKKTMKKMMGEEE